MNAVLEALGIFVGLWAIAGLALLAFYSVLPSEPPRCARRYTPPGEVERSAAQWGSKGARKF